MKDFVSYLTKIKNYSDKTVGLYSMEVDRFCKLYDYKTATKNDIFQYLNSQNGNSIKNLIVASLKIFYKFKIRNGEITTNPTSLISYFKTQRKSIIPITSDEMDKIINPNNFHSKEDYILFETLYLTGMRINELHSLSENDILQNSIKVTGKGNKQRVIHLPQYAIDNLISISKDGKIGSYSYNTLRNKMTYYLKDFKRANLTNSTKLSSHGIRHSFATHLHKSGANILSIKDALGHSSVQTTSGYTHLDIDFLKQQHSLLRK